MLQFFFSNYSVYVLKVEIYSLFCHDIMLGSIIVFLYFLPTFSNKFLSKKLFIHYSLHYLFRHTKRLDLFSYQSEVNLMLNNDFVYFQPTCFIFHQRFPSNYCLGMTFTYFFVPFGLKLPVECRFWFFVNSHQSVSTRIVSKQLANRYLVVFVLFFFLRNFSSDTSVDAY